ncbi:conserved hypothetical protein [Chlamydia pneumoniae LPCoLN]|uniref:hypothetical protein n=1 Tax=Chlamydia pneumoniae TaxID=83558 RepID=UPI0001BD9C38|nr:hypothetical protein [Chlamydia pneumoniae]ACZ32801.1 conserved hypothetical protein [Chlamydia pneumoniae LPCoLN]
MDNSDNSFHTLETEQGSFLNDELAVEEVASTESTEMSDATLCFADEIQELPSPEKKVAFILNKMREALTGSSQGSDLRLFWDLRKQCLPLFNEIEDTAKRADHWRCYIELTKEGRHLKGLQDEEGSFVVGQIDLAITCLEKDILKFQEGTEDKIFKDREDNFLESQALDKHQAFYKQHHTSLLWLSSFSSKIIDLRKELMNVGMRMRLKSKFFQRLSNLGNQVFPKRKELIEKVSQTFAEDVDAFVAKYFIGSDKETLKKTVFFLRKEIKNLQHAAKRLFVSSHVFAETRLKLSKCWDQLKGMEKEIRQEQGRLRVVSAENSKEVRQMLAEVSSLLIEGNDLSKVRKNLEGISKKIRALDLTHDDVISLKKEMQQLFDQLREKQDAAEHSYQEQLAKDKQVKKEAARSLAERITTFSKTCSEGNITSESREEWQTLKELLGKMSFLPPPEKISLDNQLNLALQTIVNFFEEQLLSSPDSREKLVNMRQVLKQRRERRQELKDKLEQDKKLLGSSGLDFDRAMQYSALVEEDKRALEELDASILELKQQIQQLL